MNWRPAKSLVTLLNQVNKTFPNRSRASDGLLGDTAHRGSWSDHNPNSVGVVCALDITHDPANGLNAHKLADLLITHRHPNLKYVVSNDRIAGNWTSWQWTPYQPNNPNRNPHVKHIHVSVGVGEDGRSKPKTYDNTKAWTIKAKPKGAEMLTNKSHVKVLFRAFLGRYPNDREVSKFINKPYADAVHRLENAPERRPAINALNLGRQVTKENWEKQLNDLRARADELAKRPSPEAFEQLRQQVIACQVQTATMPLEKSVPDELINTDPNADEPKKPSWLARLVIALFNKKAGDETPKQ